MPGDTNVELEECPRCKRSYPKPLEAGHDEAECDRMRELRGEEDSLRSQAEARLADWRRSLPPLEPERLALQAIAALESEDDSGTGPRAIARAVVYVGSEIGALVELLGRLELPEGCQHAWSHPSESGMQVCELCNLWRQVRVAGDEPPEANINFPGEVEDRERRRCGETGVHLG